MEQVVDLFMEERSPPPDKVTPEVATPKREDLTVAVEEAKLTSQTTVRKRRKKGERKVGCARDFVVSRMMIFFSWWAIKNSCSNAPRWIISRILLPTSA